MKSNHIVVIYFLFVIAGLALRNMMESLTEMTELGQTLGYDGCLGFNGPLRQYFSLYRAVSQREGERGENG